MGLRARFRAQLAIASLFAISACVGYIEEPERRGEAPKTGVPEHERPVARCNEGGVDNARARLRRLSDTQYVNAVEDLLPGVRATKIRTPGSSDYEFINESELLRVGGPLAFEYQAAASSAARQAVLIPGILGCDPELDEDGCARSFIEAFASRAFRRPLQELERTELWALFELGRADGFAIGVETVIEAVLQAPDFLYRTEFGNGAPTDANRFELSPHELASAVSFFLLDSIPDEPLWRAAQDGSISDVRVMSTEVDRLLTLPRVRANLNRIFLAWLGAGRVLTADKPLDPAWDVDLRQRVLRETELFVDDVVWSPGGDLTALLTSRRAFVDGRVAELYGVSGITGSDPVPVQLPEAERAGILTRVSLLAALGRPLTTDIVHRGLFVRRLLLCLPDGPPPPPEIVKRIQNETITLPERRSADFRASDAVCSGCHSRFDPFGIPFEIYDTTGRYRTEADGEPVRAAAEIDFSGDADGLVDGVIELSERLAQTPRVSECVTSQLVSYALGRSLSAQDDCTVQRVNEQSLASEQKLVEIFRAITLTEGFRFRAKEEIQ